MKYTYIAIFKISGFSLPTGAGSIVLLNDTEKGLKASLVDDIVPFCEPIDRGMPVGCLSLTTG